MAARRGAAGRRHPGARPTHGDEPAADHGAEPGALLCQLSPRAQPCGLEQPGGIARPARPVAGRLRPDRAGGAGPGRHDRAPSRQAHRGQGHLPRPRAFQPPPLREGQRLALARPDAPGPDPLGGAGMGTAVPDRPCSLGALLPRAQAAAQETHRLGAPTGTPGSPLAARARAGAGRRQQLRRPGILGRARPPWRGVRHAAAAGRRPL